MAVRGALRWSRDNLPKAAYVAMTTAGMIFVWQAKTRNWDASLAIGVPVALMFTYFTLAAVLGAFRFHDEQAGDNLYYMGFLFTLTSLGVTLYRYDPAASVDGIVRDFGLAVVTTICGIALRILYNQVRRDPIDIERSARHELAEMTRRVRTELDAASREFANFRRASNQMLEEGFEEISRQAEKSGQQILKIMEALTQEAVKPVGTAGQQIQQILEGIGTSMQSRLAESVDRMDAATTRFDDANSRIAETIQAFGDKVEAAGAKLAEVKTPDEVITIKMKPTLSALGKLIEMHSQRLEASDEMRASQNEAIDQTHRSVVQLVSSLDRGVASMEKAVDAISHSQKVTENLIRLLQQQHSELGRQLEKLSNEQTQSLTQKIADEITVRLRSRALGNSPEAASSAFPPAHSESPQAEAGPVMADKQKERGWWSLR